MDNDKLLEIKSILASHVFVKTKPDMRKIIDSVWDFLVEAYGNSGLEYKSFNNKEEMINQSEIWRLIYEGPLDDINDFNPDKCYAVGIYKNKCGLKRVASGVNGNIEKIRVLKKEKGVEKDEYKNISKPFSAWKKLVVDDLKLAWVECSGKVEKNLLKLGGQDYIIDPKLLLDNDVFTGKIIIENDGIHYTRILGTGIKVTKIAIGTIKL